MTLSEILQFELFSVGEETITVARLAWAVLIVLGANVLFFLFNRFILLRYFKRKGVEIGRSYAVTRLLKYVLLTIAFLFALESTGIKLTVLLTAAAALLVGVGIGLQQTFNDLVSGVILLIEGSVEKGDWIQVGDMEGRVEKIGLRTSLVQTRRNISIIVPNSKITVDNVINLSHHSHKVRYTVSVGVAYGSDTQKVKSLLLESVKSHKAVLEDPAPFVRFVEFADSSLNFNVLYWSSDYLNAENVRSDIRFEINKLFAEEGIEIPFPQQVVHTTGDYLH